ncbi:TNFAIP3-interacting protein 1-like isoform X2 [Dendronephthya gigantea]|uniref:TNFAIP3-interacting protein 1-like isoform X2 n=1 Tax=Dendronephthya gigantea TaxID=151771 RepID=UPI001069BBED|nr:TNFAIP3-interacting protein 1-like isoform X2 [Dendronephthya gigantea]
MDGAYKSNAAALQQAKQQVHHRQLMEVNRRWKQEYDLLKTKYLREKSELEGKNNLLTLEVSRLQNELARLAKAVAERPRAKLDCCNGHTEQGCQENGNVTNELIKEQLAAYKEDFKLEHEDKEKIQSEKKSLQETLNQCQRHVQSLNQELDVYKKECKRLQEEQEGSRRRDIKRHPSVDRSKSYPETSSLSYKEEPLDPMSSIALPPSMCSKREGYLSLRDFRHEQLKRGILVRNPTSQGRPLRSPTYNGGSSTTRRLSDSAPPSPPTSPSINQSPRKPDTSRTSCLW